ncbi:MULTISPECIES: sulfite exporter TauE/SafE family protein [Jannaschia]|uniref:sulfite exporter TauE/SafE family protein n=1 Tax=Jannaschia TaxID=188905 RepID=UPI001C7D9741|nr:MULTISPECIES: sulfite exporter TauE/SafE family protein [unclassified Jannaschia]
MPADILEQTGLDFAGVLLLCGAAALAGFVRGFSGFGSALIYIPLAASVLPPIWVLITLTVMDMLGPLPTVPRALRDGTPRQVLALGAVAALFLLPGLWLLDIVGQDGFRWLVSGVCFATVGLLLAGWRWRGGLGPGVIGVSGALSGFLGGVTGLSGPPVILTYMAAPLPVAVIRANILVYLVLWDVILLTVLALQGQLQVAPLALGALLILPYLTANLVGARLFDPKREGPYRAAAYVIIATVALTTLPIWSLP